MGHILNLKRCSEQQLVSPIILAVKKDKSIKLAFYMKQLNMEIHRNKYHMPNIENLVESRHSLREASQDSTVFDNRFEVCIYSIEFAS